MSARFVPRRIDFVFSVHGRASFSLVRVTETFSGLATWTFSSAAQARRATTRPRRTRPATTPTSGGSSCLVGTYTLASWRSEIRGRFQGDEMLEHPHQKTRRVGC